MPGGPVVLWTALAALAVVDLESCHALGLSFANWLPFLSATGAIAALGLVYGLTGRSARIAGMANGVLLWMVFSLLASILTYAAAGLGGSLYDNGLADGDAALGFNWLAWYDFVAGHPMLQLTLWFAYASLLPQILLSVFWFSLAGWEHRNAELLINAALALFLTTLLFHLFPALGPGSGMASFREAYIDELVSLRSGSLPLVNVMHLKGLIAFPSYHAVLAILFAYAYRGSWLFIPVALLNAVMLVSLPSGGGHYFIDVLAGAAVAVVTILATSALIERRRQRRAIYPERASPDRFRVEGEMR
jgi:membrane-associated phospholipid phosphatase